MKRLRGRLLKVNLIKAFLYPIQSFRRLLVAWLIVPLGLLMLAPPLVLGVGLSLGLSKDWWHAGGYTAAVIALIFFVGMIPGTFLTGYLLRARRMVADGNHTMPAWNALRHMFWQGGEMDTLIFLVGAPFSACLWTGLASIGGTLALWGYERTWGTFWAALAGSGVAVMLFAAAAFCWLLMQFFGPIASLRLALGKSVLAALSPGGMLGDIRKGWFCYVLAVGILAAAGLLFSLAQTAFPPLILLNYPVQVYLQLVWASVLGQYARGYLGHETPASDSFQTPAVA